MKERVACAFWYFVLCFLFFMFEHYVLSMLVKDNKYRLNFMITNIFVSLLFQIFRINKMQIRSKKRVNQLPVQYHEHQHVYRKMSQHWQNVKWVVKMAKNQRMLSLKHITH